MVAEEPQVSAPRDGRLIVALFGQPVSRVFLCLFALAVDDEIDLGCCKAGDLEVEAGLDRAEMLKLDLQDLRVPAGVLGDLVVGQNVGLELLVGQMIDLDRRHFGPAERPRGFDSAVTRQNRVEIVDDDGIDEAELLNGGGDLMDLLLGVSARIALVRLERRDRPHGDGELSHVGISLLSG